MKDRVYNETCLHEFEKPELCPRGEHKVWRTVKCTLDIDVVECSRCGKQKEVTCAFEDDFS